MAISFAKHVTLYKVNATPMHKGGCYGSPHWQFILKITNDEGQQTAAKI